MVQNLVPGLSVGKKINQTYCLGLVSREGADNKVEIFSGKACPTVRLNHRLFINSTTRTRNEEKSGLFFSPLLADLLIHVAADCSSGQVASFGFAVRRALLGQLVCLR